ncbi:MAG: GAP family protein [Solirubrobacteraceae bacterium]
MLRLIGLVVAIGLTDSLNPTTIGPALYLAGGDRGCSRVAQFTLAVFAVYLAGGVAIALGPGQLLLSTLPHPSREATHILEIAAGAAMLVVAGLLWWRRRPLSQRDPPGTAPERRSSAILGATITAVELPTAFPYFAAIAAIAGSGIDMTRQVIMLLLFNACFVAPLIGIVLVLAFAGDSALATISRTRDSLYAQWPAAFALLIGLLVVTVGANGLVHHDPGTGQEREIRSKRSSATRSVVNTGLGDSRWSTIPRPVGMPPEIRSDAKVTISTAVKAT